MRSITKNGPLIHDGPIILCILLQYYLSGGGEPGTFYHVHVIKGRHKVEPENEASAFIDILTI